MQDRRDAGRVGCRTGGMKDRRDAGRVGCRIGGMQDRRDITGGFSLYSVFTVYHV